MKTIFFTLMISVSSFWVNIFAQNCFVYENDLYLTEEGQQFAGPLGSFASTFPAGRYKIKTIRNSNGLEVNNLLFYIDNLTYTFDTRAILPISRTTEFNVGGWVDNNASGSERITVKVQNIYSGYTCSITFTIRICDVNDCEDNLFTPYEQVLGDGKGVHSYPALVGDFGGDDKEDIVFIGQNWNGSGLNIRTKVSNGDGTYTSYQQVLGDGAGVHSYPPIVGDFGGNDKMDIVFIGQNWNGSGLNIRTKISNGDGTYTSYQQVLEDGAGVHTYPALVGDFGGNDKMDIVFIGQNWNGSGLNIRTKVSNGDGTYTSYQQVLGDGAGVHSYPPMVGDFGGDDKEDIVFIGQNWNGSGLNIRTKVSNGDGTYTSYQQVLGDGAGVHTYPALVGDFGGNDKMDIVFVGQNWNGRGLNIRTKVSNGDGTYTPYQQVLGDGAGVHTYPALVGDFGGDGKADIAFIGQTWSGCETGLNIRVKYSQSNNWTSGCQILKDGAGVHKYLPLLGDFAGSGKEDIVFIGQNWSGRGLNIVTKSSN